MWSLGNVAALEVTTYLAGDDSFANDLTITGSIGVFATVPNIKGFSEKIGINAEQVETTTMLWAIHHI